MAARMELVGQALWPEVTGMAAAAGVQMIAAAVDERWEAQERPIAQTVATVAVLGGSALAIAKNTAPEFFKGSLYLGVGMGIVNLSRWLIERGKAAQDRVVGGTDIFALVPRRRGAGQHALRHIPAMQDNGMMLRNAHVEDMDFPLQIGAGAEPVGAFLVPEEEVVIPNGSILF